LEKKAEKDVLIAEKTNSENAIEPPVMPAWSFLRTKS
jgi:hypothetical protein